MIHFIDKFSDSINEIAKVLSINIGSILLSISTGVSIDLFAQTDSFFTTRKIFGRLLHQ